MPPSPPQSKQSPHQQPEDSALPIPQSSSLLTHLLLTLYPLAIVYGIPGMLLPYVLPIVPSARMFIPCISFALWALYAMALYRPARHRTRTENTLTMLNLRWGRSFFQFLQASHIVLMGCIIITLIINLLSQNLPHIFTNPTASNPFKQLPQSEQYLLFAQSIIIAPLLEETLFRGHMMTILSSQWNKWACVFYTAIVFAMMHPAYWAKPNALLTTLLLGLWFGHCRYAFRSTIPGILAHVSNNALATYFLLWHTQPLP